MRVDVVSIFPAYLEPLGLSLPGKARERGLLELHVHDLRGWARDRHHTVDDTPYGGGAGMVMKPEPWGEALDALDVEAATLVVPTPSGRPLTQQLARELSTRSRLVFACGRYEGIDQRVLDHYAERTEVVEVSLGDFVLNGGEVAALAVIEAVVRLLPGFMGNAESLVEESHEDGLLEYPVYTKPGSWRGHEVPSVLLSGDHGRIARWRHEQRLARTAQRRPDLLPAGTAPGEVELTVAPVAEAGELLLLQRACAVQPAEGVDVSRWVEESLADVRAWVSEATVVTARRGHRLLAAGRAHATEEGWEVDRLLVAPDVQGQGLGGQVVAHLGRLSSGTGGLTLLVPAGARGLLRAARRHDFRPRPSPAQGLVSLRGPGFPT